MNIELRAGACRKRAAPAVLDADAAAGLLGSVEKVLARRFEETLAPDERHELASNACDEFAGSTVTNYLPILVQRRAMQLAAARVESKPITVSNR